MSDSAARKTTVGSAGGTNLPDDDPRIAAAGYIFEISVELRGIASSAGLDFLAHLLDMAAEESERLVKTRSFNASGG